MAVYRQVRPPTMRCSVYPCRVNGFCLVFFKKSFTLPGHIGIRKYGTVARIITNGKNTKCKNLDNLRHPVSFECISKQLRRLRDRLLIDVYCYAFRVFSYITRSQTRRKARTLQPNYAWTPIPNIKKNKKKENRKEQGTSS